MSTVLSRPPGSCTVTLLCFLCFMFAGWLRDMLYLHYRHLMAVVTYECRCMIVITSVIWVGSLGWSGGQSRRLWRIKWRRHASLKNFHFAGCHRTERLRLCSAVGAHVCVKTSFLLYSSACTWCKCHGRTQLQLQQLHTVKRTCVREHRDRCVKLSLLIPRCFSDTGIPRIPNFHCDAVGLACGRLTVYGRRRIHSDPTSTCCRSASLVMTWSSESPAWPPCGQH